MSSTLAPPRRSAALDCLARPGTRSARPKVVKVGAVNEPKPPVVWIEQHAGVDGVAVLDAIGRCHDPAFLPFVVGRIRIEALGPNHVDVGARFWLVYGSYFGYIRLVELDTKTGKRINSSTTPVNPAVNCQAAVIKFFHCWYYFVFT